VLGFLWQRTSVVRCVYVKGVGARIHNLRTAQGKGLADIGAATGLSKGYLSELENADDTNPTLDVLQRIAGALDVTIADLVGGPQVRPVAADPRLLDDLPEGLRQFAKVRKAEGNPLEAAEIVWLASAQYRGRRPVTKEDFAFLFGSLRRTVSDDDRKG
jgi:transcriptional regulator with XRE-family HTH domain